MLIIKLGDIEIDIDTPVRQGHSDRELLFRILANQKHYQHQLNERLTMIAQEVIDASAKALNGAAANIIAHLPPSTTASTPDSAVTGLLGAVDAVTAQLNAAAGPATPPPATP